MGDISWHFLSKVSYFVHQNTNALEETTQKINSANPSETKYYNLSAKLSIEGSILHLNKSISALFLIIK